MKNLPLDHYGKFPFARKAVIFLKEAEKANEIQNRYIGSHECAFYLLSHAIELSIKAVATRKNRNVPWTHDKEELSKEYRGECNFSDNEMKTIAELKKLNDGPGGLRYDNPPRAQFLPSTFNLGVKIVKRLLEEFE